MGGGGGGGCINGGSGGEVSGGGGEVFDHVGTAAHKSGVEGLVIYFSKNIQSMEPSFHFISFHSIVFTYTDAHAKTRSHITTRARPQALLKPPLQR